MIEDGIFAAFLAVYMIYIGVVFLFAVGIYVYRSFAYMVMAKKLKHDFPWLSWIPFGRTALLLQLGGFHWAWTFLWLVPLFGWLALFIMKVIAHWNFFERLNHEPWLGLIQIGVIIPFLTSFAFPLHLVIIGVVAWIDPKKKKRKPVSRKRSKKRKRK